MAPRKKQSLPMPAVEVPDRLIDGNAERLVLGNLLSGGGELWRTAGQQLTDACFAVRAHAVIYRAMRELGDEGTQPNISTVANYLHDSGRLGEANGIGFLAELTAVPELIPIEPWIRTLRRRAVDREAFRLSELISRQTALGYSAGATEIAEAQRQLAALEASLSQNNETGTIGDLIGNLDGGLDGLFTAPKNTISTPYTTLNRLTNGGLQPSQLWVLGARPSLGKSTAALEIALHSARRGHRTAFFSLEMSCEELIKRLLANVGNLPHGELVRGNLAPIERSVVRKVISSIERFPLEIYSQVHQLADILARIAAPKRGRYELVVVDYLGLVQVTGRHENRVQELSYLSRRLKLAAVEHEVPILALSQLNRASETERRRPQLSDLRDSGAIEQDADGVLFLHQPGSKKQGHGRKNDVQLIIAKQRNGPRDLTVYLELQPSFCRFVERTADEEEAA